MELPILALRALAERLGRLAAAGLLPPGERARLADALAAAIEAAAGPSA
jgi:hypothetical protein